MALVGSIIQYLVIMVILAAISIAGAVVGKKLRDNKDAKDAAGKTTDAQ